MEGKAALLTLCVFGFAASAWGRSVSRVDPIGGSCVLDVNSDLPKKNEPLFLQKDLSQGNTQLVLPETEGTRGIIALRKGEEIIISCPGNRNSLSLTKETSSRAMCKSGTTLSIDGRDVKSSALDCSGRSTAATNITDKECADGKGVIVELGFQTDGWLKLVEVCHNVNGAATYYAHHVINGDRLSGKVYRPSGTRPGFARGDRKLFNGFDPDSAYRQRNQEQVFSQELGPELAEGMMDQRSGRFLARGHLAPDADFLFSPHQYLTYFYVNVAPQWQSINAGNWLRVEENTRRAATALGGDLEVVTGTHGVLKLPDEKGSPHEIYLHNRRLPVPEQFWKVLRNPRDNSCIAFVSSNNPFETSPPSKICTDICKETGWPRYQNYDRGYVYCCSYDDIKKAVPDMPNLTCNKELKRPY